MRQIHHVAVTYRERWALDPERGAVKERQEVLGASGTWRIGAADGTAYDREADGTFMVPDEVAAFWLRRPGWFEGASPFPPPTETLRPAAGPVASEPARPKAARG